MIVFFYQPFTSLILTVTKFKFSEDLLMYVCGIMLYINVKYSDTDTSIFNAFYNHTSHQNHKLGFSFSYFFTDLSNTKTHKLHYSHNGSRLDPPGPIQHILHRLQSRYRQALKNLSYFSFTKISVATKNVQLCTHTHSRAI